MTFKQNIIYFSLQNVDNRNVAFDIHAVMIKKKLC